MSNNNFDDFWEGTQMDSNNEEYQDNGTGEYDDFFGTKETDDFFGEEYSNQKYKTSYKTEEEKKKKRTGVVIAIVLLVVVALVAVMGAGIYDYVTEILPSDTEKTETSEEEQMNEKKTYEALQKEMLTYQEYYAKQSIPEGQWIRMAQVSFELEGNPVVLGSTTLGECMKYTTLHNMAEEKEILNSTLKPGEETEEFVFVNGNSEETYYMTVYMTVKNYSDTKKKAKDCCVASVEIYSDMTEQDMIKCAFPFQVSVEELIQNSGIPSAVYYSEYNEDIEYLYEMSSSFGNYENYKTGYELSLSEGKVSNMSLYYFSNN